MTSIFACNYCHRRLSEKKLDRQSCTSCGHGRMKKIEPKTYCYQCHSPIYDNVDPSRDVLCSTCTQISVIKASKGSNLRYKAADLKNYRKSKGYSMRTMAELLGISRRHYHRIENGLNLLNKKALRLLNKTEV